MHFTYIAYAVGGFVCVQLILFVHRTLTSPLRDIPGPFLARFTRLWYFLQVQKADFEKTNIALHQKYGPIVRVAPDWYSIASPDKAVYSISSKYRKSDWYRGFRHPDATQYTLFTDQDLIRHRETRKKFQNLYSMSSLVTYEAYVDKCNKIFSQRLTEFAENKSSVDMGHWFLCYAFDVIGEITYSQRFGFLDSGSDVGGILYALENNLIFAVLVGIYAWMHPVIFRIFQWVPGTGASGRNHIRSIVGKRIAQRKEERAANSTGGEKRKPIGDEEEGGTKDFIEKLMDARDENPEKIDPYLIVMMNMSNIIAGSDTTAVTLSAILNNLIRNPHAMKKLRDELDQAVKDGRADAEHIRFAESQKLPYLQAVLKESMRMHAAVGLPLWRDVPENGAEICGQFFPAGSTVGYNSWVGHYDSEVFGADAADFRPERWIEAEEEGGEKLKQMDAYYSPFGLGSRLCLGKHISILEMSKVVPQLIRNFNFELEEGGQEWKTSNFWFVKPVDFRVKVSKRVDLH